MISLHPALAEFQVNYINHLFQFVLFDQQGYIIESNNSFVNLTSQYGQSIYELNPFLESMRPAIERLTHEHDEISLPRMEMPIGERSGVFDYTIKRISIQIGIFYIWTIYDNTAHNRYLSLVQQERNDSVILRELESLKNQNTILNEQVAVRTREIMQQKELIESINRDLIDSITYAQRIQQALLPSRQHFSSDYYDYFVLYQPRDIVSGDFYWISQHSRLSIIAVADCTGHGVPGAFMSMMGNTLLNQIVNEREIFSPAQILSILQQKILQLLHHRQANEDISDGMDIALIAIDEAQHTLSFAGANRPMYLVREGRLEEFKGISRSIGGLYRHEPSFTESTFSLQQGDLVYLFSDGYADQFGGANNTKFMRKNFKELFLKVHHLPLNMQTDVLQGVIENWRGDYQQTDDILVMGIKF